MTPIALVGRGRLPLRSRKGGVGGRAPYLREISAPYAASAAWFTRSLTVAPICTICTGFDRPSITGPITVTPPSDCIRREEMCAECRPGITRMLAGPVRRVNG